MELEIVEKDVVTVHLGMLRPGTTFVIPQRIGDDDVVSYGLTFDLNTTNVRIEPKNSEYAGQTFFMNLGGSEYTNWRLGFLPCDTPVEIVEHSKLVIMEQ